MLSFQNGFHLYYVSILLYLSAPLRSFQNCKKLDPPPIPNQEETIGFLASKFATIWQGANLLHTYLTLNDLRPPKVLKIFTWKEVKVAPYSLQIVAFQSYFWGILPWKRLLFRQSSLQQLKRQISG